MPDGPTAPPIALPPRVTVAIPVRNGAATLPGVLRAIGSQTLAGELELLVCDSGSTDDSRELVRAHGARLIEIDPGDFAHGSARNLLMAQARGEHVALLTQDAQPAGERWLERLLAPFADDPDVALTYGPYVARPGASPATARELARWFASLAPDGRVHTDRLDERERGLPPRELLGRRTFFTDANGCVARTAWERVPFPPAAYAEDQALALAMLRAGYAKAFVPDAAVLHSHDYGPIAQARRAFDEWRGLLEVYGWREPAGARALAGRLRGELGAGWRELGSEGAHPSARIAATCATGARHILRQAGALAGSHADRLPPGLRGALSLERRRTYEPLTDRYAAPPPPAHTPPDPAPDHHTPAA